jgi:porphobilinogen synthase
MFVTFGKGVRKKISSMPGCYQFSVDEMVKEAQKVHKLGIPAIILFGIPEHKDEKGTEAYSAKGVVQKAIKAIKDKVPAFLSSPMCACANI